MKNKEEEKKKKNHQQSIACSQDLEKQAWNDSMYCSYPMIVDYQQD
jgi:hypothetical protein